MFGYQESPFRVVQSALVRVRLTPRSEPVQLTVELRVETAERMDPAALAKLQQIAAARGQRVERVPARSYLAFAGERSDILLRYVEADEALVVRDLDRLVAHSASEPLSLDDLGHQLRVVNRSIGYPREGGVCMY